MILVGIDPGKTGGYSVFKDGELMHAARLPMVDDVFIMNSIVANVKTTCGKDAVIDRFVVEKAQSMPGNGGKMMFTYGFIYGQIIGGAFVLGIRVDEVRPQTWKASILHGTAKDKAAAIDHCMLAYPFVASELVDKKGKMPDGIADAICIGEHGVRHGKE